MGNGTPQEVKSEVFLLLREPQDRALLLVVLLFDKLIFFLFFLQHFFSSFLGRKGNGTMHIDQKGNKRKMETFPFGGSGVCIQVGWNGEEM